MWFFIWKENDDISAGWCTSITYQWSNESFLPQFEGTLKIDYSFFLETLKFMLVFYIFWCPASLIVLFFSLGGKRKVCWSYCGDLIWQSCFVCVMLWICSISICWIALFNTRHLENSVIFDLSIAWPEVCSSTFPNGLFSDIYAVLVCFRSSRDSSAHPYNWLTYQKREGGTGLRRQLNFCELRILSLYLLMEV